MEEKDLVVDQLLADVTAAAEEKPKKPHLVSKNKAYHDAKSKVIFNNLLYVLVLVALRLIFAFVSLGDLMEVDKMIPQLQAIRPSIAVYFEVYVVFGWLEIILSIVIVVVIVFNFVNYLKIRKSPLPTENLGIKKSYALQKIVLLVASIIAALYFVDQLILLIDVVQLSAAVKDTGLNIGQMFVSFAFTAAILVLTVMSFVQFVKINKNLEEQML